MKTAKTSHPDEASLLRHVTEDESRAEAMAIRKHLAACFDCRKQLETSRRIHDGLRTISAGEKRSAKRPVATERNAAYRRRIANLFEQAREADRAADGILNAARAGENELRDALWGLNEKQWRGLALLFATRRASLLIGTDPRRALDFAQTILTEGQLAQPGDELLAPPSESIQAMALLLRSQALVMMGEAVEARVDVAAARSLFARVGDLGFGFGSALCDYYEGEAATFERNYVAAERLIRRALKSFEEFGQGHLEASAEAAIGTVLATRGEDTEALAYFDRAVRRMESEKDARPLTMTLNNRASSLAQLRRFDEARAVYATALTLALRHDFSVHLRYIRTGLAELEFLRGRYARALRAFRELAAESSTNGSTTDVLFAELYVAECLGRTGRPEAMADEVEALRNLRRKTPFGPSPALDELFGCLDRGTIDADLVKHVREYLQDAERGVKRIYRALQRA